MLAKKITYFTIQFCLKKFTDFTNPKSLDIENNVLPKQSFPTLQLFQQTKYCLVSEKTFELQHFMTLAFWKHFESKCVCISVYLLEKIIVPRTQDFIWCDEGCGGKLDNFLKTAHCLGLIKCWTIFHFNWTIWNFSYVSAFRYLHL